LKHLVTVGDTKLHFLQPKLSNTSIDAGLTRPLEHPRAREDNTYPNLTEAATAVITTDLENSFIPSPHFLYYFYQYTKNRSGFKALLAHWSLPNDLLYDTVDDL
jgi:hypothetical protein